MAKKTASTQKIQGTVALTEAMQELDRELTIKVAVARDCRVLTSLTLPLAKVTKSATLDFSLDWPRTAAGERAEGVRLVIGPDVPDDRLLSADVKQRWISAAEFQDGVAKDVRLEIPRYLVDRWRTICRSYTLRGRLVCREWVYDRVHGLRLCDAPVRGAEVAAYDVDRFWWWYRRQRVGSDVTDENGYFEITFRWCCTLLSPWLADDWRISPEILRRIRDLVAKARRPIPLPRPLPDPDPVILQQIADAAGRFDAAPQLLSAERPASPRSLETLGQRVVAALPEAADLRDLRVWPWAPWGDCRPDIVFGATQDCGDGVVTVYQEGVSATRWDVPTEVAGIVLVANDEACCGPGCCEDPPDGDCLALQGLGCGHTVEDIEQDASDALVGYLRPGSQDRPFGGTIPVRGAFGDAADVDYYKPQRRRLSPSPTGWLDLAPEEIGDVFRDHWIGPPPPTQLRQWARKQVDSQVVLETVRRFRLDHPQVDDTVVPGGVDKLFEWVTAAGGVPQAGLVDGVYELRFIGYEYDAPNQQLENPRVMPLCPAEGEEVDPSVAAAVKLRLDNRTVSQDPGTVHLETTEPNCDFPDICAVVINENPSIPLSQQSAKCVDPCGFARVSAGDTITVHFSATDSDGHLEAFQLSAHWGESEVFDVLGVGNLQPDPHVPGASALVGPTYGQTFLGAQGAHRAALPATDPEQGRPFWYGGQYAVTVPVGAVVPGTSHQAFQTCCAFQLDLATWKRTTNGCNASKDFHNNRCQLSFTVIREDLAGDPEHPSCSELCPEE